MASRTEEMSFYEHLYRRIHNAPWRDNLVFEGHTDNVPSWMKKIGWVLSTSDFESFHMAPAEGMASGAIPLLLQWPGVNTIYPEKYIFDSPQSISNFISSKSKKSLLNEVKAYAMENFSADANAAKIVALFDWK